MLRGLLSFGLLMPFLLFSHDPPASMAQFSASPPAIDFIRNNGQWPESIQFESSLPNGRLYAEAGKLTYVFYNDEDVQRIHDLKHGAKSAFTEKDLEIRGHRFDVEFLNANLNSKFYGHKEKSNYYNFFLGNDESKWAGRVPAYAEMHTKELWNGIDYRLYSRDVDLKYDFIVHAGADPNQIQLAFSDVKLSLNHGNLYMKTSVNEMIEMKPVAFQRINGKLQYVPCQFRLEGNLLSFEFPEGYRQKHDLVIDPKLIFSSYSGSTLDNWGFTATFDEAGNLYGGGIVFSGTGMYPTTSGAFRTSFSGGNVDIGITKFNADGTSLIYSTYLGGSANEVPHSLVVNSNNELIVMGTSSSGNYPTTTGAYDRSFNNSGSASITVSVVVTYQGCDIVLSKFSQAGDVLNASTFVGGSGYDGVNFNNLDYNYGDDVRGEVVVDGAGNVFVASTTTSNNFPVTNGSTYRGGFQDGIVFKMDGNLSNMIWSTYHGGGGTDAAYSVQVDGSGRACVAGGTSSSNFPTTIGTLNPNPIGGVSDGFVTVFQPNSANIFSSTRLGTNRYDQCYFVQLDDSNRVYVAGQTEGAYTIFPSTVYNNSYSGQFIHKMPITLDSTIFSTNIGTGGSSVNVAVDFSPSAFLVNQCDHIYLAGWGGDINSSHGNATASTTTGLPVTTGAHKTTTDGNDFYLIVLDQNADSLLYATFFGGPSPTFRGEHVDGGTSRFDKRGIVYQAVCAGCGGNNTFPAEPSNVWSTTNGAANCNLGVIKFDLAQLSSDIGLSALTKVCIPGAVPFVNKSNGGTNFFWDFGDGSSSTQFSPTHNYVDTGNFNVMLIVTDSNSCMLADTSYITVRGEAPPDADILPVPVLCPGDSIKLNASGGLNYQWDPPLYLSNDTIPDPYAKPPASNIYMLVVSDSCGSDTANYFAYDTAFINIQVAEDLSSVIDGDTVCKGDPFQLQASGGLTYSWAPPTYLNNPGIPNPVSTPTMDIVYTVNIVDQYNCTWPRTVELHVEDPINPVLVTHNDTTICLGDTIEIFAGGGVNYRWQPGHFTADSLSAYTMVWPNATTNFLVSVKSKCFVAIDTVLVEVIDFETTAMADTFACADVPIKLTASPGTHFEWAPKGLLDDASKHVPRAKIEENTTFYVLATDEHGCVDSDSVQVALRPPPFLSAGNDRLIEGTAVRLIAKGSGQVKWEPSVFVTCADCKETDAYVPFENLVFRVKLTDPFGCVNSDQVLISRIPYSVYIPNSFTPNNDRINDVFRVYGDNMKDFELRIYNRWGEIVYLTNSLETGWDGTHEGQESPSGVYVYKLTYTQIDEKMEKRGSVSLVR